MRKASAHDLDAVIFAVRASFYRLGGNMSAHDLGAVVIAAGASFNACVCVCVCEN